MSRVAFVLSRILGAARRTSFVVPYRFPRTAPYGSAIHTHQSGFSSLRRAFTVGVGLGVFGLIVLDHTCVANEPLPHEPPRHETLQHDVVLYQIAQQASISSIKSAIKSNIRASSFSKPASSSSSLPQSFLIRISPKLRCAPSMLPLHSEMAAARVMSCLSVTFGSYRALSQGTLCCTSPNL
ncbi:hypothetical protein E2542_SST04721 [Spatholobus suberectus]|nr:hypothetical protein E2542_SST04721 [Spatholobus suberectus]